MNFTINPKREIRGEGNGWDDCREADATLFVVEDEDGPVDAFDTKAEAEAWIREMRA